MEILIFMLIAKLADPILAVFAIVVGSLSRRWWHVVIGLPLVPVPSEMVLAGVQLTYQFNPAIYAIGVAAAAVWAFGAFVIKKRFTARSKSANLDTTPSERQSAPPPEKIGSAIEPASEPTSMRERTEGFAPLIALALVVGIAGVIYILTQ